MAEHGRRGRHNYEMGNSWLYAFVVFAILCSFAIPVLVLAEGGDASAEEVTVESPDQEPVTPTEAPPPPPPTAVPTAPPPTAVPTLPPPPPTAVPPTAVPTQVPPTATVAPTATIVPTPTPEPTPTPSPTEVIWVNRDSLAIVSPAAIAPLSPGESQRITVRYQVTTPRNGTTIHAELRGDVRGWTISSPGLVDADASASKAVWTQGSSVTPGTTFDLVIVITAPSQVTTDQAVDLRLWSTASTQKVAENGVTKPVGPNARFVVDAPEPTAVPSPTDVPEVSPTPVDDDTDSLIQAVEETSVVDLLEPGPQATPTVDEDAEGETVPEDESQDPDVSAAATPQASQAAGQGKAGDEQAVVDDEVAASPQASPVANLDDEPAASPVPDVTNFATPQASPVADSVPAEPTITCEPDEVENTFACHIDPDRDDVQEATITIAGAEGWEYEIDGQALPVAGTLSLADLVDDIASPQTLDVTAAFPAGCADTTSDPTASIEVELTYQDAEDELVETTFEPEMSLSDPAVTISSYSFQDMNQRETLQSIGTLTLDVRDLPTTCGWQLQIEFEDFTSEDVTVPASYLQLVDVSGIEGSTAAMTDGVLRIILPASQGQSTEATLTITTMVTFPSELPPGGYHTSVTVRAERLQ